MIGNGTHEPLFNMSCKMLETIVLPTSSAYQYFALVCRLWIANVCHEFFSIFSWKCWLTNAMENDEAPPWSLYVFLMLIWISTRLNKNVCVPLSYCFVREDNNSSTALVPISRTQWEARRRFLKEQKTKWGWVLHFLETGWGLHLIKF